MSKTQNSFSRPFLQMIPNITQQSFRLLVIFFDTLDGKFLGNACQNKSQRAKSQHVSPIFKLIRYQSIMFFSQTFFDSVVLFFSRKMFGNILFQTFYGGTVPLFQGGHGVMDKLKCRYCSPGFDSRDIFQKIF